MTRSTSHSPYRATASRQAAGSGSIPSADQIGRHRSRHGERRHQQRHRQPGPDQHPLQPLPLHDLGPGHPPAGDQRGHRHGEAGEHQQDDEQGQRQPGRGVDAHRVGRAGDVERLVHLVVRGQRPRDGDRARWSPHRARGPRATGRAAGARRAAAAAGGWAPRRRPAPTASCPARGAAVPSGRSGRTASACTPYSSASSEIPWPSPTRSISQAAGSPGRSRSSQPPVPP